VDPSRDGGGGLTATGLFCGSCGAQSSPTAKFCGECGTALAPATRSAEYKQVTVLFADVVHSMDIAAAVGPERLREIMAELADRCAAVVKRYGGTVDKFTGDGIMAVFGAPVALEDHAVRACLAALGVQEETKRLAVDVHARDGVDLQLRVGLNSGEVIAGEIGSGPFGYTAIGEQVGMAQRMESVAPPGGVMLSAFTARLVEHTARLGELQMVEIKGAAQPVPARQLLAIAEDDRPKQRRDATLVGRQHEISMLEETLGRAIGGRGSVTTVKGPPGIGKSRITREVEAIATRRGVEVISTFCESHSSEIPFHAVAGLLRGFFGVRGLAREQARAKTRATLPDSDSADLVLLDDLLGIGDAEPNEGDIDPDARRRRLTSLLNTALLAREPAVYIIEDAHWIDAVSESMLTDFNSVVPRTHALILITYRPEYRGPLQAEDTMTLSLAPLDASQATTLTAELLGSDPSVARLAAQVAQRGAGNPFFTEEIVRDLAERNVLDGDRGAYTCEGDAVVTVPATVQATIAARIDRLGAAAKHTLHAASVIGSRFDAELLSAVLGEVVLGELVEAELIERLTISPRAEYAFQHPLMRAVAYESQLKSHRAQLHRSIAAAIERREPESVEKNAALIAAHLEAAGDLRAAFGWHMRAGTWSTHRDITGARVSWQRALAVADRLPADDPDRLAMRIAPRTLLCATIWRVGGSLADIGFDELRELATLAGDKRSVAIGMSGLIQMLNFHGQYSETSRLASEHAELLESIEDPELTVALSMVPIMAKWNAGAMTEAMRLSQRAIDLSDGDPTMGDLMVGSPLAIALAMRASTRCCLGLPGWREDFDEAVAVARRVDKFSFCAVVMFKYIAAMNWALLPDDDALRDTVEALEIAEQFGDNFLLTNCEFTYGLVLVRREDTDREFGFELLARARRVALDHRYTIIAAWCADLDIAAEKNRAGDYDGAIDLCRGVLENEIRSGEGINRGWSTTVLVQSLLNRRRDGDLEEAQAAVDRLAAMPTEPVFLYHELPLLRLNALVAKARGDEAGYRDFRERYLARAESCGFDGHIAVAHAMS
jgi:adenylate cyclase